MDITHIEARRLIHIKADGALTAHDRSKLISHINTCHACSEYAEQIRTTELNLRKAMSFQWNTHPLRIDTQRLQRQAKNARFTNPFMPTRKLLMGISVTLFTITLWQFAFTGNHTSNLPLLDISPNPKPSLTMTGTQDTFMACDKARYFVQSGDTLQIIAQKFSVSIESIMTLNNLTGSELDISTQLVVPICSTAPAGTNLPPSSTITPAFQTITYTPGQY